MAVISKVGDEYRLRYKLHVFGRLIDRSRRYKKTSDAKRVFFLADHIERQTREDNYTALDVKEWRDKGLISGKDALFLSKGVFDVDDLGRDLQIKAACKAAVNDFIEKMFVYDPENGEVSSRLRLAILNRDRGKCQICGRSAPQVAIHIDHVVPFSHGGKTTPDNLQCACADCNLTKNNRFSFHTDGNFYGQWRLTP